MEVHRAAQLVLGDLGVLQARQLTQPTRGGAEMVGEDAAQGDGEAAPQLGRLPLPHHLRGVVVAVRAERLPHLRVVLDVHGHARDRANTNGLSATVSGTVLPPAIPARISWNVSAAYSREQDSHLSARRLLHRVNVTPSASSAEP